MRALRVNSDWVDRDAVGTRAQAPHLRQPGVCFPEQQRLHEPRAFGADCREEGRLSELRPRSHNPSALTHNHMQMRMRASTSPRRRRARDCEAPMRYGGGSACTAACSSAILYSCSMQAPVRRSRGRTLFFALGPTPASSRAPSTLRSASRCLLTPLSRQVAARTCRGVSPACPFASALQLCQRKPCACVCAHEQHAGIVPRSSR